MLGLARAGFVLFVAGEAWSVWFPINKQLWTSSYVMLTGGAALIVFAACIHLIEVRGVRAWSRPFVILGRNAIVLFVLSGLIGKLLIILTVPQPDGHRVSLQVGDLRARLRVDGRAEERFAHLFRRLPGSDVRGLRHHVSSSRVSSRVVWHDA